MKFSQLITTRRSCRTFGSGEIPGEQVQAILRAALLAPSSMNRQSWHFVVVDNKTDLAKLADSKERGAFFVKDAAFAVVVVGQQKDSDCWVEDGSIAATYMQLQAEDLGLGSCWVQIRNRRISDGTRSEDIVKGILDIPEEMGVLCIIAFGNKQKSLPPHSDDDLAWEKVHVDQFTQGEL